MNRAVPLRAVRLSRLARCRALLAIAATLLTACAVPLPVADCPACAACPRCAEPAAASPATPTAASPALQAAGWEELPGWRDDDPREAWVPLLRSCRALRARKGWSDWQAVCEAAEAAGEAPADRDEVRIFFETRFRPWALTQPDGSRDGLVTGYYEPVLKGSRMRTGRASHPVLAVPDDLLVVDLAALHPELRHLRLRGRLDGRRVVPYPARAEIRARERAASALPAGAVLAWVEDPVELFFLHVQGSGRIALADGGTMRVGFADQNGHPYQSIGRLLIERGEIAPDKASMQGIQTWARANPGKLDETLDANPSYVFFRELPDGPDGPPGALGQPLQAGRSIAVDPRHVPLGAPVFVATTQPGSERPLRRLVLAQDTGGAIKGVVRADYFWGSGADAGQLAGRMKQAGRLWVLLPIGVTPP